MTDLYSKAAEDGERHERRLIWLANMSGLTQEAVLEKLRLYQGFWSLDELYFYYFLWGRFPPYGE